MTREEAKDLLFEYVSNINLRRHHLAAEATMRAFARTFGADEEKWGMVGLLHDMDWERVEHDPDQHTKVAERVLSELGVDQEIIDGVRAHHPSASGKNPETLMEKTIFTTEELTGLIIAAALVKPEKNLASVRVDSVLKKLKDKAFARGVDREVIGKCEEMIGLPLAEVVEITLNAMQGIHEELGL